jgi:hypothetical protein
MSGAHGDQAEILQTEDEALIGPIVTNRIMMMSARPSSMATPSLRADRVLLESLCDPNKTRESALTI